MMFAQSLQMFAQSLQMFAQSLQMFAQFLQTSRIIFAMQMQMHDIDSQIDKITGQSDYMAQLKAITGNIFDIDKDYLKVQIQKILQYEKLLLPCLINYLGESHPKCIEYSQLSSSLDIAGTIKQIIKKGSKKSKKEHKKKDRVVEIIDHSLIGKDMLNHPWFLFIKETEFKSDDLLNSFDTSSFENVKIAYQTDPGLLDIKVLYGVPIGTSAQLSALKSINKITKEIIDIYTRPMYDIKKKIINNWSKLHNVFRDEGMTDNIQNILVSFIVCKYRCEITGNSKYYMTVFKEVVEDGKLGDIEGSRFIRFIDSIDLGMLTNSPKVVNFTKVVKTAIEALDDKSRPIEDILNEIQKNFEQTDADANSEELAKVHEMDDPLGTMEVDPHEPVEVD